MPDGLSPFIKNEAPLREQFLLQLPLSATHEIAFVDNNRIVTNSAAGREDKECKLSGVRLTCPETGQGGPAGGPVRPIRDSGGHGEKLQS